MDQPVIVAEISKSWPETADHSRDPGKTLGMLFEQVITVNHQRGYRLRDWRFSQTSTEPYHMTETIIAIFDKT